MNKTINILHLEDLPSDAILINKALKKSNIVFQILTVDSRDKFISALTEFSPDIILSDHSLPSFNSIEALDIVKRTNLDIPFIIVTATMSDEAAVELILKGADDYILKDRLGRLPIAMSSALEKFRLKKQHQNFLDKLIESEKRYRALIEHSADGVVILDVSGKPTYVSASVTNVLGYEAHEVQDMDLFTLMHSDDIEGMALMLKKILAHPGETIQGHTGRMLHKDGSWRWIEATITNLLGDPAINGIIDNFRDVTERKLAEQLLRESEQFNKAILASLSAHICVIDNTGTIIKVNKAWDDFGKINAGVSLARTSKGTNYFEVCDEAILAGDTIVKRALDGILSVFNKDHHVFEMEYQCDSPDQTRWFIFHVMKFGQDETKVVLSHQDITEKKALERLLDKATTMARIGSYEVDFVNNHMFWSPMTKLIHEVDCDFTPAVKTSLDFYKAGMSRENISAAILQAYDKQTPFDLELQVVTARGNERWVRVIGEAALVSGKRIVYGSIQDIDKIKKTELELQKAYEEKNIILESIGDAFFTVDKDWTINYWNKEAARLMQHAKSQVLNKNLWEVFAESTGSESYKQYNLAVASNQIVHFEDYYQPLDSWLEVSAYPSANGLSVFFKDITARKLSEKKLNKLNKDLREYTNELVLSNKGLEQFSYMVSHNLRAPVANIIGLGGLLSDESYPSNLRQDFLTGILDNVKRLDDVIVDLNLILQVKREISEKNETVNLMALVDNIQSSIQSLILKEHVQIVTDFGALSEFETMRTYLHSIFYNLITNSIKYHQPGIWPVIEIRSRIKNGKVAISFQDNGLGIDLSRQNGQIFGLYKRFHHHVDGRGMGLFMVKTQVEMLGGTISVASAVDVGTTFLIEFNL